MSVTDDGLLFVYSECGPDVTESEFNDWYDNEHAPARLTVPGFSNAARYKATDSKLPSWLAICDLTSPDVLASDTYMALGANASHVEKYIISRLATLNRRLYRRLTTVEKPEVDISTLPAPFVLVVGLEPTPGEQEEDQNRWYEEEHLPMLSKVPGFLRVRRYKLVTHVELGGKADASSCEVAFPYIALYDLETDFYASTTECIEAMATPWTVKVLSGIARKEFRLFKIYRHFAK